MKQHHLSSLKWGWIRKAGVTPPVQSDSHCPNAPNRTDGAGSEVQFHQTDAAVSSQSQGRA